MHFIQELPLGHLIILCAFAVACFYLLMDYLKNLEDRKVDTDFHNYNLVKIIEAIDNSSIINDASKCQLIDVAIRCFSEKDVETDFNNDLS